MATKGMVNIGGRMVPAWLLDISTEQLDSLVSITPHLDAIEWLLKHYSNPNLLDNWYFVGGGSQQGGGQFPINQRGLTEYTRAGYTIDRWYNRGIGAVRLDSDGLTLIANSASTSKAFNQRLENPVNYFGKTVTISVLIDENTLNGDIRLEIDRSNGVGLNSDAVLYVQIPSRGVGLFTATGQLPDTLADYGGVNFAIWIANGTGTLKIRAAKLELGSHQTLAHESAGGGWILNDPPPKYGEELAECQRYYLPGTLYGNLVWKYRTNDGGYFIPTPVTMRSAPTIIGVVKTTRSGALNGVVIPANKIDCYVHPNGVYLFLRTGTDLNTDTDFGLTVDEGGISCDL